MGEEMDEATKYLETGGLGEVIGLAYMAQGMNQPKVQMDTDMAIALCRLAIYRPDSSAARWDRDRLFGRMRRLHLSRLSLRRT